MKYKARRLHPSLGPGGQREPAARAASSGQRGGREPVPAGSPSPHSLSLPAGPRSCGPAAPAGAPRHSTGGGRRDPTSLVVWLLFLNDKHPRCAGFTRPALGKEESDGGEAQRAAGQPPRRAASGKSAAPRTGGMAGKGSDGSGQDRKRLRSQSSTNITAPGPFAPSERAELSRSASGAPSPGTCPSPGWP